MSQQDPYSQEILEKISPEDLFQVVKLINDRYQAGYETFLKGGYQTSVDELRHYLSENSDSRIAMIRNKETQEVVASLIIRLMEPNASTIMFHKFVAHPKVKGLGKRLLRFAERWALVQNPSAQEIRLEALKQAESLVKYYRSNQYEFVYKSNGELEERWIASEDQKRVTEPFSNQKLTFVMMAKARSQVEQESEASSLNAVFSAIEKNSPSTRSFFGAKPRIPQGVFHFSDSWSNDQRAM